LRCGVDVEPDAALRVGLLDELAHDAGGVALRRRGASSVHDPAHPVVCGDGELPGCGADADDRPGEGGHAVAGEVKLVEPRRDRDGRGAPVEGERHDGDVGEPVVEAADDDAVGRDSPHGRPAALDDLGVPAGTQRGGHHSTHDWASSSTVTGGVASPSMVRPMHSPPQSVVTSGRPRIGSSHV
jgi:hypothetical protein